MIADQNLHFLQQGQQLLDGLEPELYVAPGACGESSVGAHLRHVIDCYQCFLGGLASGDIDYDARSRQRHVERDPQAAAAAIGAAAEGLSQLDPDSFDRQLRVRVDAAAWSRDDAWSRSTVGRELQFMLSHTVHHYAMIASILRARGQNPPSSFGVAPSTLEHLEQLEQCEPRSEAALCAR